MKKFELTTFIWDILVMISIQKQRLFRMKRFGRNLQWQLKAGLGMKC